MYIFLFLPIQRYKRVLEFQIHIVNTSMFFQCIEERTCTYCYMASKLLHNHCTDTEIDLNILTIDMVKIYLEYL